jgi:hypothetical protein
VAYGTSQLWMTRVIVYVVEICRGFVPGLVFGIFLARRLLIVVHLLECVELGRSGRHTRTSNHHAYKPGRAPLLSCEKVFILDIGLRKAFPWADRGHFGKLARSDRRTLSRGFVDFFFGQRRIFLSESAGTRTSLSA